MKAFFFLVVLAIAGAALAAIRYLHGQGMKLADGGQTIYHRIASLIFPKR